MAQVDPVSETAPDSEATPASCPRCGWFDLQSWLEVLAGIVIALIALLTSYDHIALSAGAALQLPQQWGVWCIAASVALVVADAQLATGSQRRAEDQRLQAENEAVRERNQRLQAENEADRERNRAAQERERAARSNRVQARALRAGALVQLEPSVLHRRFLALVVAELAQLADEPA